MKKERNSNIELLRIILMFMIMALHANLIVIDFPTVEEVTEYPLHSFMRFFNEYLCIGAVNTFVLISGWFGIKYKTKGLCNFLFQCLFFSLIITLPFILSGKIELNKTNLLSSVLLYKNAYWFVWSYLILYIISPMLNSFIENSDKHTYRNVLISLFIVQTVVSVFTRLGIYNTGYHPLSFIALYMLARYTNVYRCIPTKYTAMGGFLACVITNTLLGFLPAYLMGEDSVFTDLTLSYTNPLNIAGALFLLLFFVQIELKSKIINYISVSCFSVYLLHTHFCLWNYYSLITKSIYNNYSGFEYYITIILFMTSVFIAAIIIDKIRIICFDYLWNRIDKSVKSN